VNTVSSSTLSIRLDSRTKSKLEALAKASRRSKSFLAAEAIEAFVAAESWQLSEIEAGIRDLDADRAVDHQEVRGWLQSWGKKSERKAPR
jgi:predicted transcriptional regulator